MAWVCPNCGTNNEDSNTKCSVCSFALPDVKADLVDKPYIFVSYAHADAPLVYPFIKALQEHFYVWFDKKGIKHGSEYAAEIEEKIDNCAVFLYMITSNSMASKYCRGEINHAFDLEKPFVNILLHKKEDIEFAKGFHMQYGIYQYFQAHEYKDNYATAVRELYAGVETEVAIDLKSTLRLGKSLPTTKDEPATTSMTVAATATAVKAKEIKPEPVEVSFDINVSAEVRKADDIDKQKPKSKPAPIATKGELSKELAEKLRPDKDGTLVIPSGYDSIGAWAFQGKKHIKKIVIPNSVTSIGNGAFLFCTGLTFVAVEENNQLTSIGYEAFHGCAKLASITIPNSVTSIGNGAFAGCKVLTLITVEAGNKVYHIAGNCLIETESKKLIAGCKNSVIPTDGSVTSIGVWAFRDCEGLMSVTIPSSVTSIGRSAFDGCTKLKSITFEGSSQLASIDEWAISHCYNLTSITIPDSVTSIGEYTFYGCTGLTSITIPDSVTSIGYDAFAYCTGLTSVTIGNGVTSIGIYAFRGCSGLTSITFEGTQAQWNAISKGSNWDNDTGNYTIHCTDGDIAKS